jgi:hypothetical protein
MGVSIRFDAIAPEPGYFKAAADAILKSVDAGVENFAKGEITDDFNETQKTFRRKFPVEVEDTSNRSQVSRDVFIDHEIYFYVSGGTAVRYATMSPDWQSKTAPGRLSAGSGRGRVLYVSRNRPRPGIEARKFDEQIVKKEDKPFERAVRAAIEAGVRVAF